MLRSCAASRMEEHASCCPDWHYLTVVRARTYKHTHTQRQCFPMLPLVPDTCMTLLVCVCAQVPGRLPVCPAEAAHVIPGVVISPDATQNQKLLHLTQQKSATEWHARVRPPRPRLRIGFRRMMRSRRRIRLTLFLNCGDFCQVNENELPDRGEPDAWFTARVPS